MGFFRSLAGMVTAELTSADLQGSLRAMTDQGIQLLDMAPSGDLSMVFRLDRRDVPALRRIAAKRGERLKILKKDGIYWDFKGLLKRPVLLLGMTLIIALTLVLPSRVLFVQVQGNEMVPSRLILEAAANSGIGFGASRREVRSEKMKNTLLSAVPQLQWAGVNTYGCVAVISVRERSTGTQGETDHSVSSIVASRDGFVLSCTVTRGNGLVTVGQAVKEGEVLISGYTDCGLSIEATRAEGEILAQTRRELTVITPSEQLVRGEQAGESTKFSLLLGKNRINFYQGSGISDASCVKMYSKYVLTLPGGFELPVALIKETVISYDSEPVQIAQEDAAAVLSSFASDYLKGQMVAGTITDRLEAVFPEEGIYRLTGNYVCTEMIGKRQQEQIGEYHEAN